MASAQNALPNTDVFICDVSVDHGKYQFTNLQNITNREGYDNQPSFIDNNKLFYVSIREDKQADIYCYDIKKNKTNQVARTKEDEYSPTLMSIDSFQLVLNEGDLDKPYYSKFYNISTVRVEKDSTQRLWKMNWGVKNTPYPILDNVKGVGYHCWINDSMVALFILGEPFTLQIANVRTGSIFKADSNIGRSLQKTNTANEVAYVSKADSVHWFIKVYNFNRKGDHELIRKVIELPKGAEDFVFGPDKAYWLSSGSKLLRFDPETDKKWKEVYDFKGTPAENFYRIAFSPDGKRLALVSYIGKKP
jgi:hypothetical protein